MKNNVYSWKRVKSGISQGSVLRPILFVVKKVRKANRKQGLVKRTFSKLDKVTLPLPYSSLVRSHLDYGNGVHFAERVLVSPDLIKRESLPFPLLLYKSMIWKIANNISMAN